MKFGVLPTYDLLNILIVSQMVVNMLDKALAAANSGGVGQHFPPPKDNYVRQDTDSYSYVTSEMKTMLNRSVSGCHYMIP